MLNETQYQQAAKLIGCDTASVHAVRGVESGGSGFMKDGRIILKFEGHVFHRLTGGKFDKSHPTISYPAWTEKYSQFGKDSYLRFDVACALDLEAALKATSWGMFQIMGGNFSSCGFKNVNEMVTSFKLGEAEQLNGFCTYVKMQGLAGYLIKHQWASFAKRYNGADYQKHHYDLLLQHEYEKFATAH